MATVTCEICSGIADLGPLNDRTARNCGRCGQWTFPIPGAWVHVHPGHQQIMMSAWVREQNDVGLSPTITIEIAQGLQRRRKPTLRERATRLLLLMYRRSASSETWELRERVTNDPEVQARSYSDNPIEASHIIRVLEHDQHVEASGIHMRLTMNGYLAAEGLSGSGSASAQGFIAMWFAPDLAQAYTEGFDPALRAAGYQPFRIDQKDFTGGISDEMIAEIRKSRFVVADYTGHRPNVYFEAGFALGLGIPVFPTCRADEIKQLGFDIAHLNTVPWTAPQDLVGKLSQRIKAVIGQGPHLPA